MVKKILSISLIGILFTSCEKDKKISPVVNSTSEVQNSPYSVSTATAYYTNYK
jgi:branched-subunit amino acid transport protein AzlD